VESLREVQRHTRALVIRLPQMVLRQGVALIRRLVPPTDGFSRVGGYAVAIFVRFAEM
jgi:hypothetical protein